MSRINEVNLLNKLKSIYDQYSSVECMVFTTFEFDPDFFANHLVSELMGRDHEKISTISELKDANQWIMDNHVSVFYDISGLRDNVDTLLTIPIYPVRIKTGVFHPKVIAIFGKAADGRGRKISHLIVSSANLTVNGYARNLECFSAIEVTSGSVARSLAEFLEKLNRKTGGAATQDFSAFVDYLKYSSFSRDKSVEFFWNIDIDDAGREDKLLKNKLAKINSGDVQIISPYFDKNGPEEMLKAILDKNRPEELCKAISGVNVTIYPSKDGDFYNIYKKDYNALKKKGVNFEEIKSEDDKRIRFIHAKIIRKGGCIVVGSYNFTEAALSGKNAEAALIFYTSRGKLDLLSDEVDHRLFLNEGDVVACQDSVESVNRVFITLTVDWKERNIRIDFECNDEHKYYIKIGTIELDWDRKSNTVQINNSLLEDCLLKNKSFTLYEDGKQVYCGRFNEINWSDEIRPEIACKDLGEAVAEWFVADKQSTEDHTNEYDVRKISGEDEIIDVLRYSERKETDVFDNYFNLASAMNGLLKSLKEAHDNKTRYKIFSTSPGSMRRILGLVQEKLNEDDADPAYYWLILNFLDKAYKLLPDSAAKIANYDRELIEFRRQLNDCIKKCRSLIIQAPALNDVPIDKFLKWIDREFYKK